MLNLLRDLGLLERMTMEQEVERIEILLCPSVPALSSIPALDSVVTRS
jgi:hypothetical protein